jgi:hypothetical protein
VDRTELRRRLAQHPNAVRYEELAQLLRAYGFEHRPSRRGSSHQYWFNGVQRLSIPYRRPHLKRTYVDQSLAAIVALEEQEDGDGSH